MRWSNTTEKTVGITVDVLGFCVHSLRATAATNALAHHADVQYAADEARGEPHVYGRILTPQHDIDSPYASSHAAGHAEEGRWTCAPQVLIVEDEGIIALDLRRRLTRVGYAVVAMAGSGADALQQAQVHRPDLVLMDIGLPGEITGLEAAARIWEALQIPIVYVTAFADAQTFAQVKTPPPLLAVRKPFDAAQLESTLAQALAATR
jgi:CheY-like chemotaxis protein